MTTVDKGSQAQKWFDETVSVPKSFRELLFNYSHIPEDKVDSHVITLRNRAWDIHPYPCLGQFRFLELNLAGRGELYTRLLTILKSGGRFLDVGTCLGQDLRKLVYDGAPASSVAGAELNAGFIELGYELFGDRVSLESSIVTANILEPIKGSSLQDLEGKLDVVQLGMILHLFSWEEQLFAFENAIKLLKPEQKGTLIIGQASGNVDGIPGNAWGRVSFKHNAESFEKLIKELSEKTGTQWKVTASLDEGLSIFDGKRYWDDPKTRRLLFEVESI